MSAINVCHVISGDLWGGAEAQAFGLIIEIYKSREFNVSVIVFNEGELREKLIKQGVYTELINENECNIFSLIIDIYSILKKRKIQLIHTHGIKENLVAGFAGKFANIRLIRTHHGKGMLGISSKYVFLERMNAVFLTHRLISVSDDLKEFLLSKGLPVQKITTIKNGIKCLKNNNREFMSTLRWELGIESGDFIFGTVGRVSSVKNQKFLINSLPEIISKFSNVKIIIVGDGPLMQELKTLVNELSLTNHVIFTGYQTAVTAYFDLMDVFVLTSTHEGIPIAVLEAMCAGLPVISSDVGGIPEIISNYDNGVLFELNNMNQFINLCLLMLSDDELKKGLSKRGLEYVTQIQTLENTVNNTKNIYQEFLL